MVRRVLHMIREESQQVEEEDLATQRSVESEAAATPRGVRFAPEEPHPGAGHSAAPYKLCVLQHVPPRAFAASNAFRPAAPAVNRRPSICRDQNGNIQLSF